MMLTCQSQDVIDQRIFSVGITFLEEFAVLDVCDLLSYEKILGDLVRSSKGREKQPKGGGQAKSLRPKRSCSVFSIQKRFSFVAASYQIRRLKKGVPYAKKTIKDP